MTVPSSNRSVLRLNLSATARSGAPPAPSASTVPETLDQVAEQSRVIAERLDASDDIPVKIVWKPVLTDSDNILSAILEAGGRDNVVGVITWMHTFSPAKMWIRGLKAPCKPLLHLHTRADEQIPWSSIDMDFMNLNQAAHGDRHDSLWWNAV
jgi:L-arabinose isomerase